MMQQVLDLDRHVIGDGRVRGMQRFDDPDRVGRPVEEIGIAESDVLCTRIDLGGHVGEHHVGLHDPELSVVDGDDRTVPAKVAAPSRRFGVPHHARAAVQMQRRIARQRWKAGAIGDEEMEARNPLLRSIVVRRSTFVVRRSFDVRRAMIRR
jgi:hypothetical protein